MYKIRYKKPKRLLQKWAKAFLLVKESSIQKSLLEFYLEGRYSLPKRTVENSYPTRPDPWKATQTRPEFGPFSSPFTPIRIKSRKKWMRNGRPRSARWWPWTWPAASPTAPAPSANGLSPTTLPLSAPPAPPATLPILNPAASTASS